MRARRAATFPMSVVATAATLAAALAGSAIQGGAQQQAADGRTVWAGVYTVEQAERGKRNYEVSCSSCHQPGLTGAGEAPPLSGGRFMQGWRDDTLGSLFTRIRTSMPFDDPSTLPDDVYLDIMTYILQLNALPAGSEELKPTELERIKIVAKESRGTIPSSSLVQVIGCLMQNADRTWALRHSTEPVSTSSPTLSRGEELRAIDARPLGTETLRLLSVYPDPAPHQGHKVEVKGLLVRMANETRISVSSWQMVGVRCEP